MIPAGIERDKAIAEKKGDDISHDYTPDRVPTLRCMHCYHFPHENSDDICDRRIKPYSTEIACAMELWEEMKGAGSLELETFDKSLVGHVRCTLELPEETYFYHETETEADAISGAWLKWKEGK